MKSAVLYSILPMLLLIASCGKEIKEKTTETKVTGNIIDASTQTPMSNMVISITENEIFDTPGSDIAEITSDVNGHYSYTFDADPDNYYHLILREENYQGYSFVTSFEPGGGPYFKQKPIVVGETNNLNLNPATVASLKVHAIGDTGADSAEIYLQHDKIAYFNINGAKMFSSEEADFQPAHSPSGLWEIKVKSWTSGIESTISNSVVLDTNQFYTDTLHF